VKALWTVRALERNGYQVNLGRNGSAVRVICENGHWQLSHEENQSTHPTLAELTTALQKLHPKDEVATTN
jgi:hypothetical protein